MTTPEHPYTPIEEQQIRAARAGAPPVTCPRCAVAMREQAIGGGSFGLGYARRRTWLLCPSCRNSVIFDAERGTRT